MNNYIVYGYGFSLTCGEKSIVEYIIKHKTSFCHTEEEIKIFRELTNKAVKNEERLKELFCDYSCEVSTRTGIGAAVSTVLGREKGIEFEYHDGKSNKSNGEQSPVILLPESMPWDFSERERNLTEELLSGIMVQCTKELGIQDPDIGLLEVRYNF